jgi:hypothetical protein
MFFNRRHALYVRLFLFRGWLDSARYGNGFRCRSFRFRSSHGFLVGFLLHFRPGAVSFGLVQSAVRHIIGHIMPVIAPQLNCHVLVDGAGVRLLFSNAQFGEPL